MNKVVEVSNLPIKPVPILSDVEAGELYNRWSFLNIYSLTALRDIYLIAKDLQFRSKSIITRRVNELQVDEEHWEERKVLEYLTALVKFGLLRPSYDVAISVFDNGEINSPLSKSDKVILKDIFFTYFRFKEISSWFIGPENHIHKCFNSLSQDEIIYKSKPLYYYCNNNRFTDTFLIDLENNNYRYFIDHNMSHLMRFWDVYLKWGTTLEVIDKFNLSSIGFKVERQKDISIVYFTIPMESFDLMEFIHNHFKSRSISIPELIFKIVVEYRFAVEDVKSRIIYEITTNDQITFERTSQIFIIKGKESQKKIEEATYLYPKINDHYISNIILRR